MTNLRHKDKAADQFTSDWQQNYFATGKVYDQDAEQRKQAQIALKKARFKKLIGRPLHYTETKLLIEATRPTKEGADTTLISWHNYGKREGTRASYANTDSRPRENSRATFAPEGKRTSRKKVDQALKSKAHKKWLSQQVAQTLLDWCPDSPLVDKYQRAHACGNTIFQNGKTLISMYCKQRFCITCNGIRAAKLLETWTPIIEKWSDPHLLTLTIKNVTGQKLAPLNKAMLRQFARIMDATRKRWPQVKALVKYECTHNQQTNEFHPHLHIITGDRLAAEFIRMAWVKYWQPRPHNQRQTNGKGRIDRSRLNRIAFWGDAEINPTLYEYQDLRPCNTKTLKEVFKYVTKIASKTQGDKQSRQNIGGQFYINAVALDTILRSLPDKFRTFRHYGVILTKEQEQAEDIEQLQSIVSKYVPEGIREWKHNGQDWICKAESLQLTGFNSELAGIEIVELEPPDIEPPPKPPPLKPSDGWL